MARLLHQEIKVSSPVNRKGIVSRRKGTMLSFHALTFPRNLDNLRSRFLASFLTTFSGRFLAHPVFNRFELDQVTRLLYRQYRRKGYCAENADGRHFSPFMFGSTSRTFVLRSDQSICGTMSVFPDSQAGLPLEKLYPEEVNCFRRNGRRIAEVGLLALELETAGKYSLKSMQKMAPLFVLIKMVINYALHIGLTDLLIAVHPCHAPLYRFIGFEPFAEVKSYDRACGNPALPMVLDLSSLRRKWCAGLQHFILDNPVPRHAFDGQLLESPEAFRDLFADAYSRYECTYSSFSEAHLVH